MEKEENPSKKLIERVKRDSKNVQITGFEYESSDIMILYSYTPVGK